MRYYINYTGGMTPNYTTFYEIVKTYDPIKFNDTTYNFPNYLNLIKNTFPMQESNRNHEGFTKQNQTVNGVILQKLLGEILLKLVIYVDTVGIKVGYFTDVEPLQKLSQFSLIDNFEPTQSLTLEQSVKKIFAEIHEILRGNKLRKKIN